MKLPLKGWIGIEDMALTEDGQVAAKVAGVGVEWGYRYGGGIWSVRIPVAVADNRGERKRLAPVIDVNWAAGAALGLLWLLSVAIRRRSKRDDGRESVPAIG